MLTHQIVGEVAILRIQGKITAEKILSFNRYVDTHILSQKIRGFIINLSHVPFVDSSGLGFILQIYQTMAESKHTLVLCAAEPEVNDLLELTGLDNLAQIVKTERVALSQFRHTK